MKMLAVFDIGTNSIKVVVGRVPLLAVDAMAITRLGEGLQRNRRISSEAARRTIAALSRLRRLAERHGAESLVAVGTRALRAARNARAFVRRCERETGLRILILTERAEASLGFAAAALASRARRIVAVDLGGGSLEIMTGTRRKMERSWSLPLGAVALTERFLKSDPPRPSEIEALNAFARRRLARIPVRAGGIIGIGGTVHTLEALLSPGKKSCADLERLADKLARQTAAQRKVEPGRADIIVAGARVLVETLRRFRARTLDPCPFGLRHALLAGMAREPRR